MVFEPVILKDPIMFYLMKKKGKPLSNIGITGKAEFTYSDDSTEAAVLEPTGENGFTVQVTKMLMPDLLEVPPVRKI